MTVERLPWFPCYPSKLLGALSAMKPTEGYVYWIVCLRIYEVGGPCPDTLEALCRRTGYNRRVVSDALDRLFRTGKLISTPAGIINPFAADVIRDRAALHDGRVRAGREGGIRTREKASKNQKTGPSKAAAEPEQSPTHLQVDSERKKDSEARASAPSGAPELPLEAIVPKTAKYTDSTHELWGEGPLMLAGLGMPEKKSRPMIGMWLKQTGDAQIVLAAIQRARDHRVNGPVEWITRALQTARRDYEPTGQDSTTGRRQNGADAIVAGMGRVARRFAREEPTAGQGREIPRALDPPGRADPIR